MGKIIIPKNSASIEEVMGAMQIYYDANNWLSNADYIQAFKSRIGVIGDDTDSSAYSKRTEIGSYYGFLEWEDISRPQSPRRITPRGRQFLEHYNVGDTNALHEDIMKSLKPMKRMLHFDFHTQAEIDAVDSLPQILVDRKIKKVMPSCKRFSINHNRLYGKLPDWLLYHPALDMWAPQVLVFPQEGRAQDGTLAVFENEPANMDYYYKEYTTKKQPTADEE